MANGNSGDPKMYNNNANQIYRVVGGRKHVQKSEAGMQTESNTTQSVTTPAGSIKQPVQEHYDWKQVQIMHHTLLAPSFASQTCTYSRIELEPCSIYICNRDGTFVI